MAKIEDTKLFRLYFHELFWLASNIQRNCEFVFEECPSPDNGGYIKVSQEIHARINAVLRDAANVKKLLHTPEHKSSRESKREYQFRQARSKALRKELEELELDEMLNAKVRNSVEHFDEYVDGLNIDLLDEEGPTAPAVAYNMTLSHREVYDPQPFPVRLYVANERTFYNLKYSIDLAGIAEEARELTRLLREERLAPEGDEGPGGALFILTDDKQESPLG